MNIALMTGARIKLLGILTVASLAAYLKVLRPMQLRWGATDEEVACQLPGDDVVEHPTFDATRAVTIEAGPGQIWPWLMQIGYHRAGWYSYDWIDNLFRPSVDHIVPELQHLAVGDVIPMGPGESSGLWVKDLDPNSWMLWWDKKGYATWLWFLDPIDEGRTRLITRVRAHYRWITPSILFSLPMDVGDIIMMRKSMLGIKRRAEATARSTNQAPETAVQEELEAPVGGSTRPTTCSGTSSADLPHAERVAAALRRRTTIRGAPHHNTAIRLNSN